MRELSVVFASTVDIIAAVAAVAGVVVAIVVLVDQIRARRPILYVNFSGATSDADTVTLSLRIRNDGNTPVRRLRAGLVLDGVPTASSGLDVVVPSISPRDEALFAPALARPAVADIGPDGKVTFHGKRLAVEITYNRRRSAEVEYGEVRIVG
jgi:hypothetical protein